MLRLRSSLFENSHFAKNNRELDTATLAAKAGFFHKDAAGLYSLMHLGVLAQSCIEQRLRVAFDELGAAELRLALLQDEALWQATGRVEAYDGELMGVTLSGGGKWVLGATAEELITAIARAHVQGRSGDRWVYQIGTKWRDELRCRAGLVRAREFAMLDAYAFSSSDANLKKVHDATQERLLGFFAGLGLDACRVEADTGQMGGVFSEEVRVAVSEELSAGEGALEVAHSFLLGDRYSRALDLKDAAGAHVRMGCQGVGVSRTLMAWLDRHRDERGFFGTREFSAVDAVVVALNQHKDGVLDRAVSLAQSLDRAGMRVVLDDRDERAGKKLADSELMGTRWRVVVSDRSSDAVELTKRATGTTERVDVASVAVKLREE